MANAEKMANSILIEKHGVFALLWDAKEDLVQTLLILHAVLSEIPTRALLLTPGSETVAGLRNLIETRVTISEMRDGEDPSESPPLASELWLMFLQQASYATVGPLLNGWRNPLRQALGTILIVRHADFESFQRSAPDLASYIGPRIFNASNLLSLFSINTWKKLNAKLPEEWTKILDDLPGAMPLEEDTRRWIMANSPDVNE